MHWLQKSVSSMIKICMSKKRTVLTPVTFFSSFFFIFCRPINWMNSAKIGYNIKENTSSEFDTAFFANLQQFPWWLAASKGGNYFKLKLLKFQLYDTFCIFEPLISASVKNSNKLIQIHQQRKTKTIREFILNSKYNKRWSRILIISGFA